MSYLVLSKVVDSTLVELDRRKKSEEYYNDPVAWTEYMTGMKLWSKQRDVAMSVVQNKSTAVKAGHGVGKSLLVAVLICWWVDTRYPDAFVASTAPSQKQIGAIVWREVRKIKAIISQRHKDKLIDHELPGYITMDNEWKSLDGIVMGFGRKPPDNKEGDQFQGLHGQILAVGDEAVGLSEDLIEALANITSNETSRRILIANPTNPGSHFGKIFREDKGAWALHTISVLDSPNFTDEKYEMPPDALKLLTGPTYVEDKKKEYGEDSPRYKARIQGEFAWDLGDTLMKPEDIAVGVDAELFVPSEAPVVLGVDVARFGADSNVIYSQQGGIVRLVEGWPEQSRVTETAKRIHRHAVDLNASEVRIDSLGIGGGVIDYMMDEIPNKKYTIIEMNASGETPDRKQWHNARAWWWDRFRFDLREGNIDLDVDDERLHDELMSVEYKFNAQSGGLLIESKDDMRKRGVKSPDYADAAIFCAVDLKQLISEMPKPGDKLSATPDQLLTVIPSYLNLDAW